MEKRGKMRKKRSIKAVSPVVSTLLLIVIVVILAIIIFLWARSFIGEAVEKEIVGVKKTIDKFCQDVSFEASISGDNLYIINKGNIPIHEINVKRISKGKSTIKNRVLVFEGSTSNAIPLIEVGLDGLGAEERVVIIPVLLGKTVKTNELKKYTCPESVGYELEV